MVLSSKAEFGEDNFFRQLHVGYILAAMDTLQPLRLTGALHHSGGENHVP